MHEYTSQTYILGLCPTKSLHEEKNCMSHCISDTKIERHTWLFLRVCYLMLTKLQQTSSYLKVNPKRNESLNLTSKKTGNVYLYFLLNVYLILPKNIYLYPKTFISCLFRSSLPGEAYGCLKNCMKRSSKLINITYNIINII